MVATRRARSNNAAPAGKKVLKDVTNARGRELPGKIQDAGPQTAPPNEGAIALCDSCKRILYVEKQEPEA